MSNSIYIEHNPFTIKTKFEVNGYPPDNISYLEMNAERRLQLWVENLFPQLCNIFNGDPYLDVIFKGVEADFSDIQAAADKAKQDGMIITLKHIEAEESDIRLEKIQKLMEEVQIHPIFKSSLQDKRSKIHQDFEAAFDKNFDVYVAATMSAGKSTLINAMLGTDLLPAANEATTATIAQITDNDAMEIGQFKGCRINKNEEITERADRVDLDLLKIWNSEEDTKLIVLEGNIVGIQERENVRLVLTDTPGPNNSQDPEHSRTTMSHIQDSRRNPLILYILNAMNLGVTDDQRVLEQIAKIMQQGGKQAKDRFIFVVNKMDQFDPEAGENIEATLERVKRYLEKNNIADPLIYPVSANLARLLRKREMNPSSLTRNERGELATKEDLFMEEPSMNLIQYMPLTTAVRRNLTEKKIPEVLKRSGLPAIEAMIDEYIHKYNLPNRVNRAYQALSEVISISSNEAQLVSDLNQYLDNLSSIEEQVTYLKENKDISIKAKAKMDILINDKKSLYPTESILKIDNIEAEIRSKIFSFQNEFLKGEHKIIKKLAENRINILLKNIEFETNKLINSADNLILESQEITEQKLITIFNDYVKSLFEEIEIPLPVLNGLKEQIVNIGRSTNLGLKNEEVEEKISYEKRKIGTEIKRKNVKVDERGWYNPLSWFLGKNVYEERDVEVDVFEKIEKREEIVDLEEVWSVREPEIRDYFNSLTRQAVEKLEEDTKAYANTFKEFIDGEFQTKFEEILVELNSKLQNREETQKLIDEANVKLSEINSFKERLNKTLEL